MNYNDLLPFMGGVLPPGMTSGSLDIDPRALMIGGILPGILNASRGGSSNLSTMTMPGSRVPGLLNTNGSLMDNIPDFSRQLSMLNFLINQNNNVPSYGMSA